MSIIQPGIKAIPLAAFLATTVSAAAVTNGAAQAAEPINFGIISTESQSNLRKAWEPLLADMTQRTGLEVKPFFASDYAGVIEGMRFGKVQVAWYGNKSAMEAVDRADGEVFAQSVDVSGNPGYWSIVVTPKNSALNSLDDLLKCDKSLNFGIGDPNSTSGYLVPMTFIFAAKKIDPKQCFQRVVNANHETNLMAAANGQVDAAVANTESLAAIEKNNPTAFQKIKVIWKSPLIPADPLVWRKDLSADAKEKIKTFFLTYGTDKSTGDVAAEKKVLQDLAWAPFRASTDDQLLPIRIMELTRRIAQVEADKSMAADARTAELSRLNAEKAGYESRMAAGQQG
jgi:phosphonate transport system substrate-binding protein